MKREKFDRPVKVTCVLATPVAGLQAPYLDSLCELIMARKMKSIQESSNGHRHMYDIQMRGQPIPLDGVGKIPIPIARRNVDGLPIPRCSSPILVDVVSDHASHFTSAFPIEKYEYLHEKERSKVRQSGGRFKSFRIPLRMRLVDRIVWFAVLRDQMTVLRRLLKQIHHIGKKSSQGHGIIKEWIVEGVDNDYSWYATSGDGTVLMRPLPADMDHPSDLIGYRKTFGGFVGPYWQRDFWREIYEPC